MYLAYRPGITVNKICKTYDVLRSKCTGTISDSKPARTSSYDGTEPVILLCLERYARTPKSPTSHAQLHR